MIKKFIISISALSLLTSPLYAGRFGGASSSRSSYSASTSRSYSTPSSTRSFSSQTYTKPTYNYRPAQTRVVSRSGYYHNSPVVINHYHSGYGYGYHGGFYGNGGILNNPFFWLYLSSNHNQQQPVVVQGQGAYPVQDGSQQVIEEAPNPLWTVLSWILEIGIFAAIVYFLYRIVRRVIL